MKNCLYFYYGCYDSLQCSPFWALLCKSWASKPKIFVNETLPKDCVNDGDGDDVVVVV